VINIPVVFFVGQTKA